MQGERDSTQAQMAAAYETHLRELITRVRALSAQPELPMIIGRITPRTLNPDGRGFRHAHREVVRAAQISVAESDRYAAWVDCDDLPQKPDHLHFVTAGGLALGRRFAQKLMSIE